MRPFCYFFQAIISKYLLRWVKIILSHKQQRPGCRQVGKNWQFHNGEKLKASTRMEPKEGIGLCSVLGDVSIWLPRWVLIHSYSGNKEVGSEGIQSQYSPQMCCHRFPWLQYMLQHRNLHQISLISANCMSHSPKIPFFLEFTTRMTHRTIQVWRRMGQKIKDMKEEERDRREPKDVLKHVERNPSRCLLSFAQLRRELVQIIDSDVKHAKIAYDLSCKP